MPKSSSSLSPTITPMSMNPNPNPNPKSAPLTLPPPSADDFLRSFAMVDDDDEIEPDNHSDYPFTSLLEEPDPAEALIGDQKPFNGNSGTNLELPYIDPTPHISSQFYTFNRESHALMIKCILEGRLASPEEIRVATPQSVLGSWRNVWKDRNEDTAYLTAWKRIQDKLNASSTPTPSLFFKSNPGQRVSSSDQWLSIVSSSHADPDQLRHLTLKDTLDRIKSSWTVGAKFYGIPESFVRLCLATCPICNSPVGPSDSASAASSAAARNKRRRFEYTETLELPAKDVPRRLQQLAAKHKVVLCIRQKYIRYKPFMAEVKDYACHRAGEPASSASGSAPAGGTKKGKVVKREPYQSKRCGCGFRIRAIVPITNYNEKDKTFVYQEEGTAVFKLYAVHSGHEPGPLDGNARIVHRLVGTKGAVEFDPEIYGLEDGDGETGFLTGLDSNKQLAMQQVQELKGEVGSLEGRITKMPPEMAGLLVSELGEILNRVRKLGLEEESLYQQNEHLMLGPGSGDVVTPWGTAGGSGSHLMTRHHEEELMEEEEADYGSGWEGIVGPGMMKKDFDEKLDGFYHGAKWYESPPRGLVDAGTGSEGLGFGRNEIG
ncbi:hypothetical protein LUZ60_015175 [Juncus effusus]|nr:hypothetical protein LUZ60_015175 [Juncus effusus]